MFTKKNIKFLYVIFSISIILLLFSCNNTNYTNSSYSYKINDKIESIDIDWKIGNIEIVSGEQFDIEESSTTNSNVAPLTYSIINNKIIINHNNSSKNLKITLNNDIEYSDIIINSKVSNITINNIRLKSFIANTKKGVINITSSSINYVNVESECSDTWTGANIKNNNFNVFFYQMQKIYLYTFTDNICNFCNIDIRNGSILFSNNNCKNTNFFSNNAIINLILYYNLGYHIQSFAKQTYIDFETISYNNIYIYGNGINNIYCNAKNGTLNIKRIYN